MIHSDLNPSSQPKARLYNIEIRKAQPIYHADYLRTYRYLSGKNFRSDNKIVNYKKRFDEHFESVNQVIFAKLGSTIFERGLLHEVLTSSCFSLWPSLIEVSDLGLWEVSWSRAIHNNQHDKTPTITRVTHRRQIRISNCKSMAIPHWHSWQQYGPVQPMPPHCPLFIIS